MSGLRPERGEGAYMIAEQDVKVFQSTCDRLFQEISKDIIGQQAVVEGVLVAMIAGGNVLLEGVPGLGKTRLVRTLGRVFDMPFSRIQFTPDLMPADVTGTNIVVKDASGNSRFQFQEGPIFSNIILADEINRATPKTQSALLEAMQEHTVTVGGASRKLPEPFFVLATQNPIEQEGTYPLPEAQMDRFLLKLTVPFPSVEELEDIVKLTQQKQDTSARAAANGRDLLVMRDVAREMPVADGVMRYGMLLVAGTHGNLPEHAQCAVKYLRFGASPRAAQALISGAKVRALMAGRYNVSYADLDYMAYPVLRHRIALNFEAMTEGIGADDVIRMLIGEITERRSG